MLLVIILLPIPQHIYEKHIYARRKEFYGFKVFKCHFSQIYKTYHDIVKVSERSLITDMKK